MYAKRFVALALVVALLIVGGCAENSFICQNKDTILNGLQLVVDQANMVIAAIESQYPGTIPPAVYLVLAAAQWTKTAAQDALAKACPVVADLTSVQEQMTYVMMQMRRAGIKLGTK